MWGELTHIFCVSNTQCKPLGKSKLNKNDASFAVWEGWGGSSRRTHGKSCENEIDSKTLAVTKKPASYRPEMLGERGCNATFLKVHICWIHHPQLVQPFADQARLLSELLSQLLPSILGWSKLIIIKCCFSFFPKLWVKRIAHRKAGGWRCTFMLIC